MSTSRLCAVPTSKRHSGVRGAQAATLTVMVKATTTAPNTELTRIAAGVSLCAHCSSRGGVDVVPALLKWNLSEDKALTDVVVSPQDVALAPPTPPRILGKGA